MKSAIQAFNDSDKYAWFTNIKYTSYDQKDSAPLSEEEKETARKSNLSRATDIISELINKWEQPIANSFTVSKVVTGYCVFVELRKSSPPDESVEDTYIKYMTKFGKYRVSEEFR